MQNTTNQIQIKPTDNLVTITQWRERKEDHWNNLGVNISLEESVEVHLKDFTNRHTKRAKEIDLRQFVRYLTDNGLLTIGDLGKLIAPELRIICEGFLDGLGQKKATLQRKKATIKVWFDFLQFSFPKLIKVKPKMDSDKYKLTRNKGVTKAMTLEEWFRLKQELEKSKKNPRLLVLCQCALLLGGRRISELLNLKWSDLEFEKSLVVIRPSKKSTDETIHFLPMTAQLKCLMESYRDSMNSWKYEQRVFPVRQQSVDQSLKRYGNKTGIKNLRFHSLRASFITWANERGDTQSEILNATLHKSTQMIRYYDRTSGMITNSITKLSGI